MRRCSIPPYKCRHRYAAPCCADCEEKGCEFRCENSPERCRCWVDKPPVQGLGRGRRPAIDGQQAAQLYRRGLTQTAIARELGCHRNTVHNALLKMGEISDE